MTSRSSLKDQIVVRNQEWLTYRMSIARADTLQVSKEKLANRWSIVGAVLFKLVVWTDIAELKLGGKRCHLGIEGFHKFSVYQDSLRNTNDIQDYSNYKTGGMKKDDRLIVFIISWILMPKGSNHAHETTEDLYLLKALKEKIQILIHFGLYYIGESSESYNRTSMISQSALHMMQMQHTPEGWVFKSDVAVVEGEARQSSDIPYRAGSEFERTLLRETRNDVLEMKENMSFHNQGMDGENEEVSNEEESTPDESARINVDKSDEEDIAEESNTVSLGIARHSAVNPSAQRCAILEANAQRWKWR
ncbi:hypothetical protein V8G54_024434 [Vigna mungo]|uniref:Uncharacterized protein n=1 Tax=Vigna mungo TaxID=3915 RepID=A0AAQ3N7F0_VIGMU